MKLCLRIYSNQVNIETSFGEEKVGREKERENVRANNYVSFLYRFVTVLFHQGLAWFWLLDFSIHTWWIAFTRVNRENFLHDLAYQLMLVDINIPYYF